VLTCNAAWETRSLELTGRVGADAVAITVHADDDRRWRLNGAEQPAVAGCIELDLAFSPATNTLPLRRLNLAVGQSASVTSAWLTFPELQLEPLPQTYRRRDEQHYDYEAPTLGFSTVLTVNADGIVIDYPPLWTMEVDRGA
jgi:hypothetical protein